MQKAFQRCSSSSLRRSISAFTSNTRVTGLLVRQIGSRSHQSLLVLPAVRSLHSTTIAPQQAAQSVKSNNGGTSITTFKELGDGGLVHENIINTLTRRMGMETMTEVQTATINAALEGTDIIAQAKTGTGKTLAFLLPILQRVIHVDPKLADRSGDRRWQSSRVTGGDIRAIIVSPTRELAEQIAAEANRVTAGTGILVRTAVGGTQKSAGLRAIQQGCHLLVGTPGRLKDILSDPNTRVQAPNLDALVFDEADRLLDQGFWPEIQEIMSLLPTPAERDRQTMMFSATVPQEVVHLVRDTLRPGFQFVKCVRDDEEPTHTRVSQKVVVASKLENSTPALIELCAREIQDSKKPDSRPFKAIVYFNSTAEVSLAFSVLRNLQNPDQENSSDAFGRRSYAHPWSPTSIYEIHSRLTQAQRTRASDNFRNCKSGILLSSDVTARGMDFPDVTHVIQVGLPSNREQYIHRVGRTARAGKEGEAWMILTDIEADEAQYRLKKLPLKPDNSLATAQVDLSSTADIPAEAGKVIKMYRDSSKRAPREEKAAVYKAFLGIFGWFPSKRHLIHQMNRISQYCWDMPEPPALPFRLAQKLRIDRVEGVRIGEEEEAPERRREFDGGRRGGSFDRRGGGGGNGGFNRFGNSSDRRGGGRPSYDFAPRSDDRRGGFRKSAARSDPF